jgi:release factor glutamine methyltransferase
MKHSPAVALRPIRIRGLPGVWRPQYDARLLAEVLVSLQWARGASVLELFAGTGALAIVAARAGARRVTAVDLSRRALLSAKANAAINSEPVKVRRSDMFARLAGESFDLVLANPPYIPGSPDLPGHGIERAWEGGYDGRLLIDRFCEEAPGHLNPGGRLLIVHSSLNGEQLTLERLQRVGLRSQVRLRHTGRLGPVSLAREQMLRSRGLLTESDPIEETLVISGEKPRA